MGYPHNYMATNPAPSLPIPVRFNFLFPYFESKIWKSGNDIR